MVNILEIVQWMCLCMNINDISVLSSHIQISRWRWSHQQPILPQQSWSVTAAVIYLIVLPSSGTTMDRKLVEKHLLLIQSTSIMETTIPVLLQDMRISPLLQFVSFLQSSTNITASCEAFYLKYCTMTSCISRLGNPTAYLLLATCFSYWALLLSVSI